MAILSMHDDRLRLALTASEKLAGLHGDIEVPLSAVTSARVERAPLSAVRGVRAPGLAIPGRVKIGTWRGRGRRAFVVARRDVPAVRVTLAGTGHDELLVSTPEAEPIVAALTARLAG
jgi:hypothetical protein